MEQLSLSISFALGGLSFILTILLITIWCSISRLADNAHSISHRLDKIIDIFEYEKSGNKRSVSK